MLRQSILNNTPKDLDGVARVDEIKLFIDVQIQQVVAVEDWLDSLIMLVIVVYLLLVCFNYGALCVALAE